MADFGKDVSTFPGFSTNGTTISGNRSVAECCLRRFITPHGSLEYDRDFGYDLRDLLNDDLSDAELLAHATRAAIECEKDERVRSADVTMTLDRATFTLKVRVTGVLVDDRPFEFTAAITQISADLLAAA